MREGGKIVRRMRGRILVLAEGGREDCKEDERKNKLLY